MMQYSELLFITLPLLTLWDHMQIHTVGIGAAIGHACLLLAAGTKGKRYMMPHSQGMIICTFN